VADTTTFGAGTSSLPDRVGVGNIPGGVRGWENVRVRPLLLPAVAIAFGVASVPIALDTNLATTHASLSVRAAALDLTAGLGLIEFTQPAALNANGEFVLQYDTGTGGLMTADVTVTRSGHKVLLHLLLSQAASHCVAQANITPAA
jgi:hypothetical protein